MEPASTPLSAGGIKVAAPYQAGLLAERHHPDHVAVTRARWGVEWITSRHQ